MWKSAPGMHTQPAIFMQGTVNVSNEESVGVCIGKMQAFFRVRGIPKIKALLMSLPIEKAKAS